jgi:hypothetical protein
MTSLVSANWTTPAPVGAMAMLPRINTANPKAAPILDPFRIICPLQYPTYYN